MITSLTVTDPQNTCIKWWPHVDWLKGRDKIEFQPGVNILIGPNGSGKSTVLTALARMLFCEQGGVQVITGSGIQEAGRGQRTGLSIQHDGSPVMYCDPNVAVGLVGGMAGFDDDFFSDGVQNAMFKGSAGQTTLNRMGRALTMLAGQERIPAFKTKNVWKDSPEFAWAQGLVGQPPEKPCPTIILDEPTRCLEMRWEAGFWRNVSHLSKANGIQVLVAAHSPFCVNLPEAHYIETKTGYRQECLQAVQGFFGVAGLTS